VVISRYTISLLLLINLPASPELAAAPTGNQLLEACQIALENNFSGMEGRLCEWYIRPCDCQYGQKEVMPPVCLPVSVSNTALAREVIAGLRGETERRAESAEMAARQILSRRYPCR